MNDQPITALFALAVSLAYMIQADKNTSVQERAEWVTVFGQLLESGALSKTQFEKMTKKAFALAEGTELKAFLNQITPMLSYSQKISVLINLYDTAMADGMIKEGERAVFTQFQRAFDVPNNTARTIREFLGLKNDISLFTDESHPYNNDDFSLGSLFQDPGNAEG